MKPSYRVKLVGENGDTKQDITYLISQRILEITVCDQVGYTNDRLTIHLDDRKPYFDLPFQGERLEIMLGYIPATNSLLPNPLKRLGTFVIDELTCKKESSGRVVAITAHAWDTESPYKQQRTESYHDTELGKIVSKIAQRSGLTPIIEKPIGKVYVWHEDQKGMNDAAFLVMLCEKYGTSHKVYDNKLLFASKEGIIDLIAKAVDTIVIDDDEILSFDYLTQGRGRYTAIRAKYHDKDNKGKTIFVQTTPDEDAARKEVYCELQETFPDEASALAAANEKKLAFEKSQATIGFTCIGTPLLIADAAIRLTNFRPDVPTDWNLSKVTHRFTRQGYVCDCECETNLPHKRKRRRNPLRLVPIR